MSDDKWLAEQAIQRLCDEGYDGSAGDIEQFIEGLEQRIAELSEICAATYQLAGLVGAPERFLNALSRQTLEEELLPVRDEEIECMERIALLEAEVDQYQRILILEGDKVERLIAERALLKAAIRKHRNNIWGEGKPVSHPEDDSLYAVLQEQGE